MTHQETKATYKVQPAFFIANSLQHGLDDTAYDSRIFFQSNLLDELAEQIKSPGT